MKTNKWLMILLPILCIVFLCPFKSSGWFDETHLAIAKAAGYRKWYNAAGADMIKLKLGKKEGLNHFVNMPAGSVVTEEIVLKQISRYDKFGLSGRLYGAIVATVRDYLKDKKAGRYPEYHMALCAHYVGDLSQPLHQTPYNAYNEKFHVKTDGIINHDVLKNYQQIKIYPVQIHSEEDLIKEIVRIANISLDKGRQIEKENRLLTQKEAYDQISHSASLFKGILRYVDAPAAE